MLVTQLIVRVIIVVVVIDTIAFYLLKRHDKLLTVPYAVVFAAITIIVLLINILFLLNINGVI